MRGDEGGKESVRGDMGGKCSLKLLELLVDQVIGGFTRGCVVQVHVDVEDGMGGVCVGV